MPQSLRLSRAGDVIDAPKSATYRVFIEGASKDGYTISPEGFRTIAADREQRRIFVQSALDFRRFLDVWWFIPEGKPPQLLGPSIWLAQEKYAAATTLHDSIYFLKARQLGESTIGYALRRHAYIRRREHLLHQDPRLAHLEWLHLVRTRDVRQ